MPKQTFFNLDSLKRDAIMMAALEEFSDNTYNEASVNIIVEKAGISKGSLYQYFEDKRDLYLYLIEYTGQIKLDYLQDYSPIDFSDFFDGFRKLMVQGTQFSLDNPLYGRLLYKAFQGPLVDESISRLKELNRDFMIRMISEAIERGEVRSDANIDIMAFFLNVLTTEFAQFVAQKSDIPLNELYRNEDGFEQFDMQETIGELIELIRHGLAPVKI